MRCVEIQGRIVRCEGCGKESPDGAIFVKIEDQVQMHCMPCVIQQARSSATRDTLMRIVGVVYPEIKP